MSLLLDALKTKESSAPSPAEPNEEALDGRETLRILTATMPTSNALTLETSRSDAPVLHAATPPDIAAVQRETAPASSNPPIVHTVAAALRSGLPPTSTAAPLAAPARKYAAMLGAAFLVVLVVMFGKSLLQKNANQTSYPDPAESPPALSASPPPGSDPSTVQVPSRPPSRFSSVGGAPEIEPQNLLRPSPMRPSSLSLGQAIKPDTPTTEVGADMPHPGIPPRSISVTPSAGLAPIDAHIESGYRALASGNVAIAQREYYSALDLDPNNVDALLGTASAASRAGNSTLAAAAYAKVLRLEPGNKDATAALTILNHDPTAIEVNESRLKVMIAGDIERRPALHAALAGVYAADRRWADAAQEYFIALSMDPGDSDLAFNLAASLDQNHNAAAALTYYAQALAFAKLRSAQIDVHAIEARISQLQTRPATAQVAP